MLQTFKRCLRNIWDTREKAASKLQPIVPVLRLAIVQLIDRSWAFTKRIAVTILMMGRTRDGRGVDQKITSDTNSITIFSSGIQLKWGNYGSLSSYVVTYWYTGPMIIYTYYDSGNSQQLLNSRQTTLWTLKLNLTNEQTFQLLFIIHF